VNERVPEGEPIDIVGVITEEVGEPRNDGTRGSGLYRVPIRLTARPSTTWTRLFVETWNHPPQFTTMHRPGIASVSGDKVILDGTTIEEVDEYHAKTLRLVVDKVNGDAAVVEERERRRREAEEVERKKHRDNVREVSERIQFK
jgi:hypothetical protein